LREDTVGKIIAITFIEFCGLMCLAATAWMLWDNPQFDDSPGMLEVFGPGLIVGGLIAWFRNGPTESAAARKHKQKLLIAVSAAVALAGIASAVLVQYLNARWPHP
jgi:hypothetical protein